MLLLTIIYISTAAELCISVVIWSCNESQGVDVFTVDSSLVAASLVEK